MGNDMYLCDYLKLFSANNWNPLKLSQVKKGVMLKGHNRNFKGKPVPKAESPLISVARSTRVQWWLVYPMTKYVKAISQDTKLLNKMSLSYLKNLIAIF